VPSLVVDLASWGIEKRHDIGGAFVVRNHWKGKVNGGAVTVIMALEEMSARAHW